MSAPLVDKQTHLDLYELDKAKFPIEDAYAPDGRQLSYEDRVECWWITPPDIDQVMRYLRQYHMLQIICISGEMDFWWAYIYDMEAKKTLKVPKRHSGYPEYDESQVDGINQAIQIIKDKK